MREHTKEPWRIGRFTGPASYEEARELCGAMDVVADTDDGPYVLASCNINFPNDARANARRIVACVNACAGIPTGMLEAAGQSAVIALRQVDELVAERNALLAALKVIAWNADMYLPATIRQVATEAIAQVKL